MLNALKQLDSEGGAAAVELVDEEDKRLASCGDLDGLP